MKIIMKALRKTIQRASEYCIVTQLLVCTVLKAKDAKSVTQVKAKQ